MTRIDKSKPAARGFGAEEAPVNASVAIDRQAVIAETASSIVIVASIAIQAHVIARCMAEGTIRESSENWIELSDESLDAIAGGYVFNNGEDCEASMATETW